MTPVWVPADAVVRLLSYEACIPLMRDAMIALSTGRTRQLLRGIVDLDEGRAFGVMPGAMLDDGFGAKLVSIFPDNVARGGLSHQGVVVLFDGRTGAPAAFVEGGELTAIRTAAASAAATDALARADARRLAILGTGEQAWRHVEAIRHVRRLERVTIWGRAPERAAALAQRVRGSGIAAEALPTAQAAARDADILCTVSAASDPILLSLWVADGAHINAVGSSRAGPAEIDDDLVARARFFADHREGVLAQGGEFLRAKAAGLIDDSHVLGEIGEVMAGTLAGRRADTDVTIYKSLGSIVQDLAAARYVVERLGG
ncbi:ornithine cyclodeaminase family protein [Sphingosinicella terrae]|uniref:ornithine cyclodeaminase family protein n=1 Tax=Sphingosinicella terrae TaxID=2172047 RepID=UPI000E0D5854|nr:ornithine cyclodeaminase family protein [Sphingosinicella terrae]